MSMCQKGEPVMKSKEYCCYIRTYSELEGLQQASTVSYSGYAVEGGVVMELRREQSGRPGQTLTLFLGHSFPQAMRLLRYLCENGVAPQQCLEVLQDLNWSCCAIVPGQIPGGLPDFSGGTGPVCGKC